MKICIDAGHYGKYNQSPVNKKYYESDMTWKLHEFLKSELKKYGFDVMGTRENQAADMELTTRGKKSKYCGLFISLHSNASSNINDDFSLACCMVNDTKNTDMIKTSVNLGKKLADKVTEIMTGKPNSGRVWQRAGTGNTDYYGVIRGAKSVGTPAILLEHGFHTNANNVEFLMKEENLRKLAEAEAKVIAEYFDLMKNETEAISEPYLVKIISPDGFINIRKTPNWNDSDIVGRISNGNTKYTIVEETMLGNTKFGRLKSGAGWISLNPKYVEKI